MAGTLSKAPARNESSFALEESEICMCWPTPWVLSKGFGCRVACSPCLMADALMASWTYTRASAARNGVMGSVEIPNWPGIVSEWKFHTGIFARSMARTEPSSTAKYGVLKDAVALGSISLTGVVESADGMRLNSISTPTEMENPCCSSTSRSTFFSSDLGQQSNPRPPGSTKQIQRHDQAGNGKQQALTSLAPTSPWTQKYVH